MKGIFLPVLLLLTTSGFSQDRFFISQIAGLGISNVNEKTSYASGEKLNLFSPVFTLNFGYQLRNARFSAGFSYFRTGYVRNQYTVFYIPPSLAPVEVDAFTIFNHFAIPVRTGSSIYLSKSFSVVPYLGVDISYNAGEIIKYKNQDNTLRYVIVDKEEFKNTYKTLSWFAAAEAYLEFQKDNVHFFAGPSGRYMMNEFLKRPYNISQRNYTVHLNFGVSFLLAGRKPRP